MNCRLHVLTPLLTLATAAGCGAEAPLRCGTEDNPAVLRVSHRAPALGASVGNGAIEQSFTIEDSPIDIDADFDSYGLLLLGHAPAHTAGYDGSNSRWDRTVSGQDITFALVVDGWSNAPAHVELKAFAGWKDEQGCHYKLPEPLLSYDITP
jgi:hypothetical protein